MRRDVRVYLADILEAIGNVHQFMAGKDLAVYVSDLMLRSAVERQLEIVGEALTQAIAVDSTIADSVPNHARIRAFRNRIVHGYYAVDHEVVWHIVESDLPILQCQAQALLDQLADDQEDHEEPS